MLISPSVICAGHSTGDMDIVMVLGMLYDIIHQVPRVWVVIHTWCLPFLALLEKEVCDDKIMFWALVQENCISADFLCSFLSKHSFPELRVPTHSNPKITKKIYIIFLNDRTWLNLEQNDCCILSAGQWKMKVHHRLLMTTGHSGIWVTILVLIVKPALWMDLYFHIFLSKGGVALSCSVSYLPPLHAWSH